MARITHADQIQTIMNKITEQINSVKSSTKKDLEYMKKITFFGDVKIIFQTAMKVVAREDTVREGTVSDIDFGDWLLQNGSVAKEEYDEKQKEAKALLEV